MKKFWQLLLTAMLAVLVLAACGNDSKKEETPADENPAGEETKTDTQSTDTTSYPYTLTDAAGEEITLEQAPERM